MASQLGNVSHRFCSNSFSLLAVDVPDESSPPEERVRNRRNNLAIADSTPDEPTAEELVRMLNSLTGSDSYKTMRALLHFISFKSANRTAFCQQGGVPALVRVLDSDSIRAVEEATHALQILSGELSIRPLLRQNDVLLRLCQTWLSWSPVNRARSTETLHNLLVNVNPENLVPSPKIVKLLVELLPPDKSGFENSVYKVARLAISKLAENPANRACLIQQGVLTPLIQSVDDDEKRGVALMTLRTLSKDLGTATKMVDEGILPPLLRQMTDEGLMIKDLAQLLINLSKDDAIREKILAAGFIELAVKLFADPARLTPESDWRCSIYCAERIIKRVLRMPCSYGEERHDY